MDSLDPLNTVDSIAPHTTSFSSNIYLLKHEEKTFTKGQILCLSSDLPATPEEILYFTVNSEISVINFQHPYTATALGRLYGYQISCIDGTISLIEAENQVALGRIYVVSKDLELVAKKIGSHQESEVFAEVKEGGTRSPGDCGEELWIIMQENFGESSELAYYWYLFTGVFRGSPELALAAEESVKILESLDIASLITEKTN